MKYNILFFICLVLPMGCSWFEEQIPLTIHDQPVIDATNERLQKYERTKIEQCKEEVLINAIAHVDSIIVNIFNEVNGDTLYFPKKPTRPSFPDRLESNDVFETKPILDSFPTQPPKKSKSDAMSKDTMVIDSINLSSG